MLNNCSAREREAVLRRAIISVKPDYYAWPPETQERYRVNMPKEDSFRIRQAVLKGLFRIRVDTQEQLNAVLESFNDAQYLLLNSALLPIMGVGDDCFFLNEHLGNNVTLLDFDTLYDYDYDDHSFQEQARKEVEPDYTVKPYRGCLYYSWARLHIGGVFYYAHLSMAANYLCGIIDELGFDKIQELIPYDYVDGKDHGKKDGEGIIYDKRIAAGGREAELEELQQRYYSYMQERQEALLTDFDTQARQRVYLIDNSQENDPCMHFVFSDKTALQAVRFRHFMKDCYNIVSDNQELEVLIEQERQLALNYLEWAYQDILDNFDSTVVKFRKKRKIILADSALIDWL
jgi:hypothetical protein